MNERRRGPDEPPRRRGPERPPRTGPDAVAGRGRGTPVDWTMPGAEPGADRDAEPRADRGAEPRAPRDESPGEPPPDERFADFEDLGGRPPPGWYRAGGDGEDDDDRPPPRAMPDAGQLLALLDGLRGAVPRELQDQITTLMREFLLALRALIDWYLERLDAPRREPDVEDIPID